MSADQWYQLSEHLNSTMKFLIILAVAVACQAGTIKREASADAKAEVVSSSFDVNADGSYTSNFKTSNDIAIDSVGVLKTVAGSDDKALEVTGNVHFISPDGADMVLTYIANENGYQPQASHIPTSPPIPEAIVRSLQYIKDHPYHEKPEK